MDSETKIKAKAYNEQLEIYKSAIKKSEQFKAAGSRAGISIDPFAKEIAASKDILDSYPQSVKLYAEAIKGVGKTTDDQLNKMVSGYEGLVQAQNSSIANVKKTRTMVNSLLAEQDSGTGGNAAEIAARKKIADAKKTELEDAANSIELAYKQQQLLLKQKYEGEETLQKEYAARMLASEIAYMQTKMQLSDDEATKIDLQSQLIDKQREYAAALKETVPEILNTENGIQKLNTRLLEESKLLDYATQKQIEGTNAQEDSTTKQIQQADTIKLVGDVMTDYVTGALNGSLDGFQTFGDTLILMSLQILKQMVPIWSAQILGLSLASPESVASWGVAGMAKYAAITGLMYAGIAVVEGTVKNKVNKKKEGRAIGGFMLGKQDYTVAEEGPEWIAPNYFLTNPLTAPIIAGLEDMRRNPVRLRPDAYKLTKKVAGQSIGHISKSELSPVAINTIQQTNDSDLKLVITENTNAIKEFMKWKPKIATELISKDLDTLEHIARNRGL